MNDEVESLLRDISEAAIFPEMWQKIIFQIRNLCPDSHAFLMLYDKITTEIPWEVNQLEGKEKRDYEDYYRDLNSVWPVMQSQQPGTVGDTDYFNVENQIRDTVYYNDFLLPNQCTFILGAALETVPGSIGVCAIGYSGKIDRLHTEPARDLLTTILPALQNSFHLSRRYAEKSYIHEHYQERVNSLIDPAFILKSDGTIDFMNATGEQALKLVRGVVSGFNNKLVLCDSQSNDKFMTLLKPLSRPNSRTAMDAIVARSTSHQFDFFLRGEGGRCTVTLIPVWGKKPQDDSLLVSLAGDNGRRVMVIFQYEEDLKKRLGGVLSSRFALTAKEVEISIAIMKGITIKDYAEMTNRAPGTVKKQLTTIFAKTGCHTQSELAALLRGYEEVFAMTKATNSGFESIIKIS